MRKIEELGYGDFEEEPIENDEIDSDDPEGENEEGGAKVKTTTTKPTRETKTVSTHGICELYPGRI